MGPRHAARHRARPAIPPLDRDRWPRNLLIHLPAALAIALLEAALYQLLDPWVNPRSNQTLLSGFVAYFRSNLVTYFAIVAVALANRYAAMLRERQIAAAELSAELTTSHLRALQAQLRPHFLFNTLNTVAELVHRDPDAADRMIIRLGALLRRSFDSFGDQEVTVQTELEFLRDYSEIVCARHHDRIRIRIDAAPDVMHARLPSLILQPLVENALRHGVEPRVEGGTVEVALW